MSFFVWAGLVEVKPNAIIPTAGKFVPIQKRNWFYYSDSRITSPQKPSVGQQKNPDTIPVIDPPLASKQKYLEHTLDTGLLDEDNDPEVEIFPPADKQ